MFYRSHQACVKTEDTVALAFSSKFSSGLEIWDEVGEGTGVAVYLCDLANFLERRRLTEV